MTPAFPLFGLCTCGPRLTLFVPQEMVISAPHNGIVSSLLVKEGDSVDGSDLVCRITKKG